MNFSWFIDMQHIHIISNWNMELMNVVCTLNMVFIPMQRLVNAHIFPNASYKIGFVFTLRSTVINHLCQLAAALDLRVRLQTLLGTGVNCESLRALVCVGAKRSQSVKTSSYITTTAPLQTILQSQQLGLNSLPTDTSQTSFIDALPIIMPM